MEVNWNGIKFEKAVKVNWNTAGWKKSLLHRKLDEGKIL